MSVFQFVRSRGDRIYVPINWGDCETHHPYTTLTCLVLLTKLLLGLFSQSRGRSLAGGSLTYTQPFTPLFNLSKSGETAQRRLDQSPQTAGQAHAVAPLLIISVCEYGPRQANTVQWLSAVMLVVFALFTHSAECVCIPSAY